MGGTIRATADNGGMLDIGMQPERKNTVKVRFFDIGGSMDAHVKICESCFRNTDGVQTPRNFYFHNFIYESCGGQPPT